MTVQAETMQSDLNNQRDKLVIPWPLKIFFVKTLKTLLLLVIGK